jgi:hypothetical protein
MLIAIWYAYIYGAICCLVSLRVLSVDCNPSVYWVAPIMWPLFWGVLINLWLLNAAYGLHDSLVQKTMRGKNAERP